MSKVKIEMTEDRLRMHKEGIARLRHWFNGYRAAGGKDYGISILENVLINLQVELDHAKRGKS